MTHDERCQREGTRDVIFLFQVRELQWTEYLPEGYVQDDEGDGGIYHESDTEKKNPISLGKLYEKYGNEVAYESWRTELVWLDREEAESWGESQRHNYGTKNVDWRVFGAPAWGQLAKLLQEQDRIAPYIQDHAAMETALARLGSMEAFRFTGCLRPDTINGGELLARIDYARDVVAKLEAAKSQKGGAL